MTKKSKELTIAEKELEIFLEMYPQLKPLQRMIEEELSKCSEEDRLITILNMLFQNMNYLNMELVELQNILEEDEELIKMDLMDLKGNIGNFDPGNNIQ